MSKISSNVAGWFVFLLLLLFLLILIRTRERKLRRHLDNLKLVNKNRILNCFRETYDRWISKEFCVEKLGILRFLFCFACLRGSTAQQLSTFFIIMQSNIQMIIDVCLQSFYQKSNGILDDILNRNTKIHTWTFRNTHWPHQMFVRVAQHWEEKKIHIWDKKEEEENEEFVEFNLNCKTINCCPFNHLPFKQSRELWQATDSSQQIWVAT